MKVVANKDALCIETAQRTPFCIKTGQWAEEAQLEKLKIQTAGLVKKLRDFPTMKLTRRAAKKLGICRKKQSFELWEIEDQIASVCVMESLAHLENSTKQAVLLGQMTEEERETRLHIGEHCLQAIFFIMRLASQAHTVSLVDGRLCDGCSPNEGSSWMAMPVCVYEPFIVPIRMRYDTDGDALDVCADLSHLKENQDYWCEHLYGYGNAICKYKLEPLNKANLLSFIPLDSLYMRIPLNGGFISFSDAIDIFLRFGREMIRYE